MGDSGGFVEYAVDVLGNVAARAGDGAGSLASSDAAIIEAVERGSPAPAMGNLPDGLLVGIGREAGTDREGDLTGGSVSIFEPPATPDFSASTAGLTA